MFLYLLLGFICGLISAEISLESRKASNAVNFIVNGQPAGRGRWPWQVSLQRASVYFWYHTCGATLIAPQYILTAAHCAQGLPSEYRAWFGAYDLSAGDYEDSVHIIGIRNHELYDPGTPGTPYDISVMTLARPVHLSNSVQIVALPESNQDFTQAECWITGWGQLNGTTKVNPRALQEVEVPVISNSACSILMLNVIGGAIYNSHICLFDAEKRSGACQGDSGGPLSCRVSVGSRWVVAGVTSWGVEGCPGDFPSVYTRTSFYREWIFKHVYNMHDYYNSSADSKIPAMFILFICFVTNWTWQYAYLS